MKRQQIIATPCEILVTTENDFGLKLKAALGSVDPDLVLLRMNEVLGVTCKGSADEPDSIAIKQTLAALTAIGPRDEIEGMLAVQMVALHNLAMRRAANAMNNEASAGQPAANQAFTAMRTFTNHVEVLSKYRGKGQQKVTVEHVHVHPGGQAIVGSIETQEPRRVGAGGPKDVS